MIHRQVVVSACHPAVGQKVVAVRPEVVYATADPREVSAVCQMAQRKWPVQTVLSGIHQHLSDHVQQIVRRLF